MTKKPLHKLPLDDWFDDVPHPYDTWPMATNDKKSRKDEIEDIHHETKIHEKMYILATKKHSPWKDGGSENFQEKP